MSAPKFRAVVQTPSGHQLTGKVWEIRWVETTIEICDTAAAANASIKAFLAREVGGFGRTHLGAWVVTEPRP